MNPEEVFALLRRADPATDATRQEYRMSASSTPSTPRRSWLRPAGIAVAAALAVFLAIGPLGLLGGTDDEVIVAPSTTVPGPEPVETTQPVDTTVPVDTTLPQMTPAAQVIVATGTGLVDADGSPLADVAAVVAFDDLAGGFVYQEASPFLGAESGTDVLHLAAGASVPRVLLGQEGDARLRLLGVFEIEAVPIALVVERINPLSFEDAAEVLYEVDLRDGTRRDVGSHVGAWESGAAAISWDGSNYVLATYAEAYTFLQTMDRQGTITPWSGELPGDCFDEPDCPRSAVATPDGSTLVFLRGNSSEIDLVVWDRVADQELWFFELGTAPVLGQPIVVGSTVIVNRLSTEVEGPGLATQVDLVDRSVHEIAIPGFADPAAIRVEPVDASAPGVLTPTLTIGGVIEDDAVACSGADGAVVFKLADEALAMVGFENGIFMRYIDPTGEVVETSDVTVTGARPVIYSSVLDLGGTPTPLEIALPEELGLEDCGPLGP